MARVLPTLLASLRRRPPREPLLVASWAGLLILLEFFGRRSPQDLADGVGVAALLGLGLFTWRQHDREPLQAVHRLRALLAAQAERFAPWRYKTGIDLRGEPPLPRATPPSLQLSVGAAVVAVLALFLLREHFPSDARAFCLRFSAALYLVLLTGLWGLLGLATLVLFFLPVAFLDEALRNAKPHLADRRLSIQGAVVLGHFLLVSLGTLLLPGWVPLALIGTGWALAALAVLLPGTPRLDVLWRPSMGERPAAVLGWGTLAIANTTFFAAGAATLVLLTRGDRLTGGGDAATTVTALFGLAFGWAAVGAFLTWTLWIPVTSFCGRFFNPARPAPTRLYLEGSIDREARRALVRRLTLQGFQLSFEPRTPGPTDVKLSLGPRAARQTFSWPLALTLADLEDPAVRARLHRRGEIVRRRKLLRGLERCFKAAARREFHKGSGYWIGAQHWFILRLSRDVDEETAWFIGPAFHRILPRPARHHLWEVLGALEIDLIFVEDGVGFRRLKRVFAMLFEYYDIFGGERRAEEAHFTGLPGVRVVIHDFSLEEKPSLPKRYPEPDYEEIGRARILHVFRDRGEDEELSEVPFEFDWRPEPALV